MKNNHIMGSLNDSLLVSTMMSALALLLLLPSPAAHAQSACYILSRAKLLNQVGMWSKHLPKVKPHYAVKCNNDPKLLSWLQSAGAGFDCASIKEMQQVLKTGAKSTDIIYAQPCKSVQEIRK